MYLTGHTGLTLGIVSLINRGKGPMSYNKIFTVMGFSLMPDILDRVTHLIVPGYPDHGVFHSVFFYALAIPLFYAFMRKWLPYISLMAMNVFFDIVNVDPRVFIYPHYGWLKQVYTGRALSFAGPLKQHLPHELLATFAHGHYLIFEAIGVVLIAAVLIDKMLGRERVIYLPERRAPESAGLD